jgi:hypothetical protein
MSVFGSQGAGSVLQCRELTRQDKVSLLRVGVGRNLLDPETEARLIASEPRLDLELHDPYKASTITFKFVAIKTPFQLLNGLPYPSKIFFTLKFYTFTAVHSETCTLRLASDGSQDSHDNGKIKLGTQYLLSKQADASSLGAGSLSRIFDIDPSLDLRDDDECESDEHMQLARYLKERVLTIDIWNGDSLMHFGTCKVPLNALMRQGEASKVVA